MRQNTKVKLIVSLSIFTLISTATPQKLLAEIINNAALIDSQSEALNKTTFSGQFLDESDVVIDVSKSDEKHKSNLNTNQQIESFSAVDLLPQTSKVVQVDLNTLCRSFPLNSRCAGYQQPVNQQIPQRPELESRLLQRLASQPQGSGFALGGKVSTLGVGIEGIGAISPNFNGRLGFNYLGFGDEFTQSNIDYDGDLQLLNATAMLDWFPSSRSGFRVTGGLMYQNNRVDAIARSADILEIGGIELPLAAVGQLEGSLTLPNTIAPYIGIGYGNPVRSDRGFGFNIDLGVVFAGSPQVDLQATGAAPEIILAIPGINTIVEDAIAREENQIEDDLDWLGVYPVISVGVSYQF